MIRINLLPRKRRIEARAAEGQAWALWLMLMMVLESGGLYAYHHTLEQQLREQTRKNAELSAQIEQSRAAVASHPEVKAKLERLRAKEASITALQSARTGPTAVLLELARILTPGRGPTVDPERMEKLRRENPLALFSSTWDARRLWLRSYSEENRQVRILGLARDGEDVSEFARRLNLSAQFEDVRLRPGRRSGESLSGLELVDFELQAKARY